MARASGCSGWRLMSAAPGMRSRWSISRRRIAARSASPRQVGCTLTCSFCHTGTQRLVRNLTSEEIVGQVLLARDKLEEWPHQMEANPNAPESGRYLTNVVLMGMGEPLYNFDNVKTAMHIVADGEGIACRSAASRFRLQASCRRLRGPARRSAHRLPYPLHGTTDEIRTKLVPLNKKYPIAELMEAVRKYPGASNSRRVTFEYVMLKGVNDSLDDAKRLVKLLKGIPAKVNLIPFNPWPGTAYECSEWDADRSLRRSAQQGGLCQPGAHAAGPRHHGRLRAAEERERAGAEE